MNFGGEIKISATWRVECIQRLIKKRENAIMVMPKTKSTPPAPNASKHISEISLKHARASFDMLIRCGITS